MFRSLKFRNYRYYYFGQLLSLQGNWMQSVAQAWLVYRLTGSAFWLGVVSFCSMIPVLLFSLVGGVLADWCNKRKLLLVLHSCGIIQALLLAFLSWFNLIEVWHIIILSLFLGLLHALEMPTRHAFIVTLVPKKSMANAIALNSSAFNSARLTGPALAGVIISISNEATVFFLNAISYFSILVALLCIKLDANARPRLVEKGVLIAFNYCSKTHLIRVSLFIVAMMSLVASSITVLMPLYATKIFAGDVKTLGYLMAALGSGAVIGALHLAKQTHHANLVRNIALAGIMSGVLLLAFAYSESLSFALFFLVILGYCQTTLVASSNTLVQMNVPDALRGRVMALFSMFFIGLMPIGALVAGSVAEVISVKKTTVLFAILALLSSVYYARINKLLKWF